MQPGTGTVVNETKPQNACCAIALRSPDSSLPPSTRMHPLLRDAAIRYHNVFDPVHCVAGTRQQFDQSCAHSLATSAAMTMLMMGVIGMMTMLMMGVNRGWANSEWNV